MSDIAYTAPGAANHLAAPLGTVTRCSSIAEASLSLSLSWPGLLASRAVSPPLVGGLLRSCGPGWFSAPGFGARLSLLSWRGACPSVLRRGCVDERAWIDRGRGRWVGCFGGVGVLWGGVGGRSAVGGFARAASGVGPFGATLEAQVNPEEQETTCVRFEYGTSTAYGSSVPCVNGSLGVALKTSCERECHGVEAGDGIPLTGWSWKT